MPDESLTMTDEEIWTAIVAAIKTETDNPILEVTPEMTMSEVPGWDSLAHVRIFLNIDANLGTSVDVKQTFAATTILGLIPIIRAAL